MKSPFKIDSSGNQDFSMTFLLKFLQQVPPCYYYITLSIVRRLGVLALHKWRTRMTGLGVMKSTSEPSLSLHYVYVKGTLHKFLKTLQ